MRIIIKGMPQISPVSRDLGIQRFPSAGFFVGSASVHDRRNAREDCAEQCLKCGFYALAGFHHFGVG